MADGGGGGGDEQPSRSSFSTLNSISSLSLHLFSLSFVDPGKVIKKKRIKEQLISSVGSILSKGEGDPCHKQQLPIGKKG